MNETERDRLAAATNALRPDWPIRSLRTFIDDNLRNRGYRDCALALTFVACDPATQTPKRVLETGPWWPAGTTDRNTTRQPPWCRKCAHPHWPDECDAAEAVPPPDDYRKAREALRESIDAG